MANWYDNVPTPTDANGELVPLGTRELVYRGETRKVRGITYSVQQECWSVSFDWFDSVDTRACTLPDSWEKLERDIRGARDVRRTPSCLYFGYDTVESCMDCPARGEANCENAAFDDILRRAKELAGVTDGE